MQQCADGTELKHPAFLESAVDACFICFESDNGLTTGHCSCKHFYHKKCLLKLLNTNKSPYCKVCAQEIRTLSGCTSYRLKFLTKCLIVMWFLFVLVVLTLTCSIVAADDEELTWLVPYSTIFTVLILLAACAGHAIVYNQYRGIFLERDIVFTCIR